MTGGGVRTAHPVYVSGTQLDGETLIFILAFIWTSKHIQTRELTLTSARDSWMSSLKPSCWASLPGTKSDVWMPFILSLRTLEDKDVHFQSHRQPKLTFESILHLVIRHITPIIQLGWGDVSLTETLWFTVHPIKDRVMSSVEGTEGLVKVAEKWGCWLRNMFHCWMSSGTKLSVHSLKKDKYFFYLTVIQSEWKPS